MQIIRLKTRKKQSYSFQPYDLCSRTAPATKNDHKVGRVLRLPHKMHLTRSKSCKLCEAAAKSETIRLPASCACHEKCTWQVQKLQIVRSFRKIWNHKVGCVLRLPPLAAPYLCQLGDVFDMEKHNILFKKLEINHQAGKKHWQGSIPKLQVKKL